MIDFEPGFDTNRPRKVDNTMVALVAFLLLVVLLAIIFG